jgi:Fic family protein
MDINRFSLKITVFHGRQAPEEATLVGYGAIIERLQLAMPFPEKLSLISDKRRSYSEHYWKVFSSRAAFDDTLYKHLIFALKYEGVNLLFFKKLFDKLSEKEAVALLQLEPTGQYSRKIWFLYEWLLQKKLDIKDLAIKNFVPLLDEKLQYAIEGISSPRHRIINNLPGTISYCPLIRKSEKLEKYISENYSEKKQAYLSGLRKDVLQRAAAFLLLKDSKASFTIEGESPKSKRAARWGSAIGQAGTKNLSKEEIIRLQQIVIENDRFIEMGFREKGGFIGEHDRTSGEPIPDHISAKWEDLDQLVSGLLTTNDKLLNSNLDAVLTATVIAFGFVFVHPFEDGNGRIHRYLIHHVLAKKRFSQQGMIFPVSSSILDHIDDYRKVLEAYSHPLLDFIEWEETEDHNVKVLNETLDYYRYFDATKQAEFLYDCVHDTIENIIPNEISYLTNYDEFKKYLDDEFEMPDKLVALLVRFLDQNSGELSKRAREKEFTSLNDKEVIEIERNYQSIFNSKL